MLDKKLILVIILSCVIYFILFFFGNFQETLFKINYFFVFLALVSTLINYLIRMFRFKYYLKVLDIPKEKSGLIFFSGLSMVITPGKIGEFLKSYLIKKINKTPISKSAPIIVVERLGDIMGLTVLCFLGSYIFFENIVWLILISGFLVFLIFCLKSEIIMGKIIKFLERIPKIKKYSSYFNTGQKGFNLLLNTKPLIFTIIISSFSWVFEGIALFFILKSLNIDFSILACIFIFSFSSLLGALSQLPGGLGAAEGSFFILFQQLGLSFTISSSLTLLTRLVTLWFGVFIGLISLILFNFTQEKFEKSRC